MSTRRLGVAVAVLGGFLYAVGGSDGTSPLNTGIAHKIPVSSVHLLSPVPPSEAAEELLPDLLEDVT